MSLPKSTLKYLPVYERLNLHIYKTFTRHLQIHLQDLRSEKYEIRLNDVDANMIIYFTANYENDICNNLIELWERDCKKEEEKSITIFHDKEERYLNNASSGFRNATQSLRKEKELSR